MKCFNLSGGLQTDHNAPIIIQRFTADAEYFRNLEAHAKTMPLTSQNI